MTGERIPASIRAAVDAIFDGVRADESLADAIARALLAERERCAAAAMKMVTSAQTVGERNPDAIGLALSKALAEAGMLVVTAIRA